MKLLNFKNQEVTNIHNLYGGGTKTGSGKHTKPGGGTFCYDSDNVEQLGPGHTKTSFYGVKTDESCSCICE